MLGKRITDTVKLIGLFEPDEGSINMYYGRIGSGKTYSATADILELLEHGQVIYCNWHINWSGFDERESFAHSFFKFIFFRKQFYKFPKDNLHYFDFDNEIPCPACGIAHKVDIAFFSKLTDCHIFVDEGQWLFDSRSRLDQAWRKMVLHTRHLNRSLNIVSQRTQAVEVSARGQVNRFFKCSVVLRWPWLVFRRTEYQDMKSDDVDDGETAEPASKKIYFARRKVMQAYDSRYLRAGMERSQQIFFEAYQLNFFYRLALLFLNFFHIKLKDRIKTIPPERTERLEVKKKRKWDRLPVAHLKGSGKIPV